MKNKRFLFSCFKNVDWRLKNVASIKNKKTDLKKVFFFSLFVAQNNLYVISFDM